MRYALIEHRELRTVCLHHRLEKLYVVSGGDFEALGRAVDESEFTLQMQQQRIERQIWKRLLFGEFLKFLQDLKIMEFRALALVEMRAVEDLVDECVSVAFKHRIVAWLQRHGSAMLSGGRDGIESHAFWNQRTITIIESNQTLARILAVQMLHDGIDAVEDGFKARGAAKHDIDQFLYVVLFGVGLNEPLPAIGHDDDYLVYACNLRDILQSVDDDRDVKNGQELLRDLVSSSNTLAACCYYR